MKIFAYGSNMHLNRLQRRVSSARKITNAFIKGYKLTCNKVSSDGSSKANIIESENPENVVWGVIFEISDDEKALLDEAEGLGNGYDETTLTFIDEVNKTHEAQVYVADNESTNNELQPYDWYRQFILTGAAQNQLPQDYIDNLQLIEFTEDQNKRRRQQRLNILTEQSD